MPMLPERFNDAFGELVADRLDEVLPGDPESAVEWLEHVLGSTDRTDDLLHGRGLDLDDSECLALADTLLLEPVLLGSLFTPTSHEVMRHMLVEIIPSADASPGEEPCEECISLSTRASALTPTTPFADLEDLAFDALSHLVCEPQTESDDQVAALLESFGGLSAAGRLRVLAAAYEEEERERHQERASVISELQEARNEHMTVAARELVDALALSPTATMSASEAVTSLGLPGVSALAPIETNIEMCSRILASRGVTDPVIIKTHRSGQAQYTLHPSLVTPMRALIRAEHRSPDNR